MKSNMYIGWSETDITPDKPVSLRGQFYRRVSEYVHSPISVTALAIETETDQIVMCSCDLCGVSFETVESVRKKLEGKCPGLDLSKIIISATHTHTAPNYELQPEEGFYGLKVAAGYLPDHLKPLAETYTDDMMTPYEYGILLAERIAEAVSEAWDNRKPGGYGPGFARAVTGHNRRVTYKDGTTKMYGRTDTEDFLSLEGGNDSGIELLYLFNDQRQLTGIVINVACPSQVVEHKNFISSDYWGEVKKMLRKQFGDRLFILAQCSSAGDQSPRDLIRRFKSYHEANLFDTEGLPELGRRISNAVTAEYDIAKNNIIDQTILNHQVVVLEFPIRRVSENEYLEAKASFEKYVASRKSKRYDAVEMAALHCRAGIMQRWEEQKDIKFYSAEIHVVRLGNIAFATNPFELFLDYGLRIKALSKADQTFIVQLANDIGKYLPTEKAEKGGHYSAVVASGNTGHEGGELLVNKTLEIIGSMW